MLIYIEYRYISEKQKNTNTKKTVLAEEKDVLFKDAFPL